MVEHRDEHRPPRHRLPPAGAAFLLAQLGAHAGSLFADRVARLDLTPPQSGLLRLVAAGPGRSQRAFARELGVAASKVVGLVDGLQARGLIERRRSPTDRRNQGLYLTAAGEQILDRLRENAAQHEEDLVAALTPGEHRQLTELLQRIADRQGLLPGVHPGYRTLPDGSPRRAGPTGLPNGAGPATLDQQLRQATPPADPGN